MAFTARKFTESSGWRCSMPKSAAFLLLCLLAPPAIGQNAVENPFPQADPEELGLSPRKLQETVETLRSWVKEGRIVGGILLVLRHGKTAIHEAVGWKDRERKEPMTLDTIFRMRSMTKPLLGTAILMLREDGRLKLDDRVSQYLPSFNNPKSRDLTIYQLLTHTSGLTGDIYSTSKGTKYRTLREAVGAVGAQGPTHLPGTRYHYSDPGSSTLGALVEEISGMPAEDFIQVLVNDRGLPQMHARVLDGRHFAVARHALGEPRGLVL